MNKQITLRFAILKERSRQELIGDEQRKSRMVLGANEQDVIDGRNRMDDIRRSRENLTSMINARDNDYGQHGGGGVGHNEDLGYLAINNILRNDRSDATLPNATNVSLDLGGGNSLSNSGIQRQRQDDLERFCMAHIRDAERKLFDQLLD